jgi:hypothetical protein
LILIGVVGGVVLHATWEDHAHSGTGDNTQGQEARKRETGLDVARRVLDWRNKDISGEEKSTNDDGGLGVKLYAGKALDYSQFRPETGAALTELTDAVLRDYVKCVYRTSSIFISNSLQMVVLAHLTQRGVISHRVSPDPDRVHDIRFVSPFSQKAG